MTTTEPKVRKLREARDPPDAWTETEANQILQAAGQFDAARNIQGIPKPAFWRALLLVGWWTGMRRGSLLRLEWRHLDTSVGWLHVPGAIIKNRTGKSFRLGDDAISALEIIRHPQRDVIFPTRSDFKKSLARDFAKILELAGIPPSRRRTMTQTHKWRRTVATVIAVGHGINAAADLLGHSSIEVTKRYVDPTKLPGQDATRLLPSISAGPIDSPIIGKDKP